MFTHSEQGGSLFDKVLFFIFQAVVFLSPIFFVPLLAVPFQIGKTSFIMLGVLVLVFGWALYKLKEGSFEIPKSFLYGSAIVVLATQIVATVFSGNSKVSFSGQGFELGTLGFFAVSVLLFLLVPLLVRTSERVLRTYTVIFISAILVALYQALRLFIGPDFMSFGVLTTATSNLVGKWNDMAVFFGFISILSVVTLERVVLHKFHKILVWIALVLSLFMVAVVNFSTTWIILAIVLGIFFVYEISTKKESHTGELKRKVPMMAMVILIISCVFAFTNSSLGNILAGFFNISQVEVRPSWVSTIDIAKKSITSDPLLGVGPNRFQNIWLLNKPGGINNTVFWNVDFNYGIGFVPSLLVTTGILGFAGMLLLIGLFVLAGLKSVFGSRKGNASSNFLVLSSFFSALYLVIFAIIYVPSASIWILMFIMMGLFVSAGVLNQTFDSSKFSSTDSQVKNFTLVLFCILLLIGTVTAIYKTTTKSIANTYFQKGVLAINRDGKLDEGERLIAKALLTAPSDVYNRFMSEIYLIRTGAVLNDKSIDQAELAQKFQGLLGVAIETARNAIAYDPTNYQNHVMLGRVYEAVVPLGVQGAYDSAKKTYEDALLLNPENPEIYLLLARLEISNKNITSAREYITTSLKKKSDYVDAIFLLSQIEIGQGKLTDALKTVEALAILSPNDPGVFFQLGLLRYNQKDYKGSTQAFERAVSINAQYANAKYFLGLSYFQTGNKAGAIAQFTDLSVSNPDNAEVVAILKNLEAGKSPFTNQADSKPEKRDVPPIREGSGSSQDF